MGSTIFVSPKYDLFIFVCYGHNCNNDFSLVQVIVSNEIWELSQMKSDHYLPRSNLKEPNRQHSGQMSQNVQNRNNNRNTISQANWGMW